MLIFLYKYFLSVKYFILQTYKKIHPFSKLITLVLLFLILIQPGCSEPTSPTNGGWVHLGLDGKTIYRLKTTDSYIYACALYSGLFRQPLFSLSNQWEYLGLESPIINIGGITDVVVNPTNENEIIASRMVFNSNMPGIFKTLDGGQTWFEADSGYGFEVPWWFPADSGRMTSAQVLFNPSNQFSVIFAGGQMDDGVYKSSDAGLTWQFVLKPNLSAFSQVNSFAEDPLDPNLIYVGGSSSPDWSGTIRPAWLQKYNMMSDIWEQLLPTLNDPPLFNNLIDNICITTYPQAIYLGMIGFVLGSKDGGRTWSKMVSDSDHPRNFFSVGTSSKDGNHLVAANGQIFLESRDAGRTWVKLKMPVSGLIKLLIWDVHSDNLYVVASNSGGIYVLPNASLKNLINLK